MNEIPVGRRATLLELAISGRPLIDVNGFTWWLVNAEQRLFSAGTTPAAARASKVPPISYADLRATVGPLRAGARHTH